jgi:hypothetical protein
MANPTAAATFLPSITAGDIKITTETIAAAALRHLNTTYSITAGAARCTEVG